MFILQTVDRRLVMMSPASPHVRIPQQKVASSVVACCIRHAFTLRLISWGGFRLLSKKHLFNICNITCYCKVTPFIITAGHLALNWNHQCPPAWLVSSVHCYLVGWSRYSCGAARSWSHMCPDDNFTRFFPFPVIFLQPSPASFPDNSGLSSLTSSYHTLRCWTAWPAPSGTPRSSSSRLVPDFFLSAPPCRFNVSAERSVFLRPMVSHRTQFFLIKSILFRLFYT